MLGLSLLVLIAGPSAVFVATTDAAKHPTYTAVDLGTLGGTSTEPLVLTAHGLVVGNSLASDGWHGFVWSKKEGMIDLGTLGGHTSAVGAGSTPSAPVNHAGEVVGQSDNEDGQLHAFLWSKHAGMAALETPEGTYDCGAIAINDHGEILGQCSTDDGFAAVVWTK